MGTLFHYKNTMKNQNFSDKILKLWHKFNRFSLHEKIFLAYLFVLCICLLFVPVIKVALASDLNNSDITRFWIFNTSRYMWTMIVILISLIVLVWRNVSTKFKNLFLTYFGWKENDSLINFLFLFIIISIYLSIKSTVNVAHNAITSTIGFTRWWNFTLVWLLIGIIFTLVSVVKWAQKTWKKTKIINVVDEDHKQSESMKEEIKKWLFDEWSIQEN